MSGYHAYRQGTLLSTPCNEKSGGFCRTAILQQSCHNKKSAGAGISYQQLRVLGWFQPHLHTWVPGWIFWFRDFVGGFWFVVWV